MSEKNFNVPNIISSARLMTAPIMFFCVLTGREQVFTWLLLAALLSDILDGVIARVFHLKTKLGAFLDSLADMGTYICAMTGLFVFKIDFIHDHWIAIACVLFFYVVEKISSYLRYGRPFNAFHTYLSKTTAYAQGAFIMSLFLFGFQWFLFYPALVLCITANIEEIIIARILPVYTSNVRGLLWVLKQQSTRA